MFLSLETARAIMREASRFMNLPQGFVQSMRELLLEEADSFFASYNLSKTSGLRANGLKLGPAALQAITDAARTPVPWADGGYYTEEEERPGKHPHYHLGLYYIQEPSAMLPAELLGVEPGHRVLDLCAAPGGKTTQLAAKLQGVGVLVTNDNAAERTKALTKNVELAGVRNAVVMNEEPERIAAAFGDWFDRVLVDAPCSGEGMFRKDEDMIRQWERHTVERYAVMQRGILRQAARLVRPGGRLVYSTCTFSPRENEGTIARFLAEFPEFSVVSRHWPPEYGFAPGQPDWLTEEEAQGLSSERRASITGAVRIWPHRTRGEGHFAVLLERSGDAPSRSSGMVEVGPYKPLSTAAPGKRGRRQKPGKGPDEGGQADTLEKYDTFCRDNLPDWQPPGRLFVRGAAVYVQPEGLPSLSGMNVIRPGWMLGSAGKHRFEPSQALAMGLQCRDAARTLNLSSEQSECLRYLKGETLQPDSRDIPGKGWVLVCIDGYPAGWGRWDGMTLKNERLPGWRWV